MVEWDRKATRAHVRKLKVKGKEDDTKKPRVGGNEKEGNSGVVNKQEFPKLPGGVDEEEDDSEEEKGEEGGKKEGEEGESGDEEEGGGGQFSRRKMQSNAWRYEQEEEEPIPGEGEYLEISHRLKVIGTDASIEPEEPEPEPDYVTMTREREGQLKGSEEAPKGDLDEEFLKDLQAQRSKGGRNAYGIGSSGAKGNVVKVDRKQFEDVTTKIAKQSTADAFRQRFAPRKAKPRGGAGGGGATGGIDLDEDVDSFLGELKLDGETNPLDLPFCLFFSRLFLGRSPVLQISTELNR